MENGWLKNKTINENWNDLQKIDYLTTQPPYFGSLLKNEQDYEHVNKVKRAGQNTMRRF